MLLHSARHSFLPALALLATLGGCAQESETEAELLARAKAIHDRVITLDTHKDISSDLASEEAPSDPSERERFLQRNDPTLEGPNQVDFPKMRAGGLDVAFFIVYVGQGPLNEEGFARAAQQAQDKFDAIHRMARRFPEHIGLARTPDDVVRLHAEGKLVACIGIENGFAMGTDLSRIAEFHSMGARYMSLAHNGHSQLGDSHTPAEPLHGGLTDLGRSAIAELNRHGIMVDVSHSSKATMMEAVAASKAPVIASHSSVDGIFPHGRNLDDEQLRALAAKGGVIQTVAFKSYVKGDDERRAAIAALREELDHPRRRGGESISDSPEAVEKRRLFKEGVAAIEKAHPPANVSDFADHIDHAVGVIGIDHVAISSDFDGGGGVTGWNSAAETLNVTLELVRRGYSEEEIGKLWSGNTLRLWRDVEAVSQRLKND
jgi:microsomal dipeptidase-like Zn-dependent dipeptidase